MGYRINKAARKAEEKIFEDESLSDEEFERERDEKVYRPENLAHYLFILGIALIQLPIAIYQVIQSNIILGMLGIICTITCVTVIRITKRGFVDFLNN